MSGGGGGGGNLWKILLGVGTGLCVLGYSMGKHDGVPNLAEAVVLAVGGLMVVFGSCEAMILSVEGLGERLKWNPFVAGTMAGLASNVPEIVMIGFVVAHDPRIAFVVTCLTLHVNSLVFGVYSGLLPKDESGHARLPEAIVKLGTDLLACAAGIFLALGLMMLAMKAYNEGGHGGQGLGATDLYAIGLAFAVVQVMSVKILIREFSAVEEGTAGADEAHPPPSIASIAGYGFIGIFFSFIGGHAVGDFADTVVEILNHHGYPEMIGAIIVSMFSGIASYLMIASAHFKGKYDIALSNVSGAVTQMPFVVLPATCFMIAVFGQMGIIPTLTGGTYLPIDLETTSVVLFSFPTLLVLWKSVSDDGKINQLETTVMTVVFALVIYMLAYHG